MKTRKRPSIPQNPYVLRAIATLRGRGWADVDTMKAMRISRRTYFACVAAIRERKERAERDD